MGMFDWVNYECICPVCKSKVDGFQSKSSDCELKNLEPTQVSNFYSPCKKCGCWIDFEAKHIENFTRTVRGKDGIIFKHTKDVLIK